MPGQHAGRRSRSRRWWPGRAKSANRIPIPEQPISDSELNWQTFNSQEEHKKWIRGDGEGRTAARSEHEGRILEAWRASKAEEWWLDGTCPVCSVQSAFVLDLKYGGSDVEGVGLSPNWRERQTCQNCGLNARLRASVAAIRLLAPDPQVRIWVAEQVTPLFLTLASMYSQTIGSEYLGPGVPSGEIRGDGLRHEDVTASSFDDSSLDVVASFDVLEHVPDYRAALGEAARVLAPGGLFIWSAPFAVHSQETLVRSVVRPDGSLEHLHPPEYHGDPINPEAGVLCFQHFGWDVVGQMSAVGLIECGVLSTWSLEYALLGEPQYFFVGRAPGGTD